MLISVRHLLDRMRHQRSRADEVRTVRERLASHPVKGRESEAEKDAATELLRLREALSVAVGQVTSCHGCARGHPEPHGHWSGGHCCGLSTLDLFNDDETAALRLSGTTPGRLTPPTGDHAGCAFRGPMGCSLQVRDRPNLCLRYLCPDLTRELHLRGDLPSIEALCGEIEAVYRRFITLRQERLAAEEFSWLTEVDRGAGNSAQSA